MTPLFLDAWKTLGYWVEVQLIPHRKPQRQELVQILYVSEGTEFLWRILTLSCYCMPPTRLKHQPI